MRTIGGQSGRSQTLGAREPRNRRGPNSLNDLQAITAPLAIVGNKLTIDPKKLRPPLSIKSGMLMLESVPDFTVTTVKTAAYQAQLDEVVLCDPTGGGFTVTLPDARNRDGRTVVVKNASASTNTITVDGFQSQTVDGSASATITTARGFLTVVSDGANWHTI